VPLSAFDEASFSSFPSSRQRQNCSSFEEQEEKITSKRVTDKNAKVFMYRQIEHTSIAIFSCWLTDLLP
jgi:hypothetical protein